MLLPQAREEEETFWSCLFPGHGCDQRQKILVSFPEFFWKNKEVCFSKYGMKFLPYISARADQNLGLENFQGRKWCKTEEREQGKGPLFSSPVSFNVLIFFHILILPGLFIKSIQNTAFNNLYVSRYYWVNPGPMVIGTERLLQLEVQIPSPLCPVN